MMNVFSRFVSPEKKKQEKEIAIRNQATVGIKTKQLTYKILPPFLTNAVHFNTIQCTHDQKIADNPKV